MSKRFVAILIAIILGFGLIFWVTNRGSGTSSGSASQPSSHIEGQGKKGVTLVEYGDYQCPVCGNYFGTVKQVADKYNSDIYFQFRNLPLPSLHPNAIAGARAAEAAALQNKYWQMHDILYQENVTYYNAQAQKQIYNTWINAPGPLSYFTQYAQQIGLDVNRFKQDYASSAVNDTINADLAEFAKTGQQQATPTFFLDGKYIDNSKLVDANGYPSVDKFSAVIDAEIVAKNK